MVSVNQLIVHNIMRKFRITSIVSDHKLSDLPSTIFTSVFTATTI